jgi:poly-gamma-glutamate synthesis protein (capsule biosynthesis protein)
LRAGALALALVAVLVASAPAAGSLRLRAPRAAATGIRVLLAASGAPAGRRVLVERLSRGRWRRVRTARAGRKGRLRFSLRTAYRPQAYVIRLRSGRAHSNGVRIRTRQVTLASVGDVNLGDGPGQAIAAHGPRYPWTGVAGVLRAADVAFGNLECAVSNRGRPVPKQYNFRGRPSALTQMRRYAGFDVVNLANNHAGDYGTAALRDTIAGVRRRHMLAVGAGYDFGDAARPRVITRLGLRIAFVGFSDIQPSSFAAGAHKAGTVFMTPARVRRGVAAARRRADVVIASFHWGVERSPRPTARQQQFAALALRAGATAVIAAHPHVLQPVRSHGRRLVAYSLGNFVFSASSESTTRTGILVLSLSGRGVEHRRFVRARIHGVRPVLGG